MYCVFICCNGHYIRISEFGALDEAEVVAHYHSVNCGSSIMFEVWHARRTVVRFVEGMRFLAGTEKEGGSK